MLVRNLLTYLHQVVRLRPVVVPVGILRVVSWGEVSEVVEYQGEILPFRCVGKASTDGLVQLLRHELADVSQPRLLFISDGQWHSDEVERILRWRQSMPNLSVRVIAAGCDADFKKLKQLSTISAVFKPDEILAALDSWDGTDSMDLMEKPLGASACKGAGVS